MHKSGDEMELAAKIRAMRPFHAVRKEYISAHDCLNCGHVITDHKRAGEGELGRKSKVENCKEYAKRDACIGNRGTCNCKMFRQPHEPKISVSVSR